MKEKEENKMEENCEGTAKENRKKEDGMRQRKLNRRKDNKRSEKTLFGIVKRCYIKEYEGKQNKKRTANERDGVEKVRHRKEN